MTERAWFHCPMCPDEVWKPIEERVDFRKPVKLKGQVVYGLCREHAQDLIATLKRRQKE